jgi:hypothetical protein
MTMQYRAAESSRWSPMTPEQRLRLRTALLCTKPISASYPADKAHLWTKARENVNKALQGGNLKLGLAGAVYIEACREMDHYLVPVGQLPNWLVKARVGFELAKAAEGKT